MNILVIGEAGFLGSNLARCCLQDRRNRVTVLDSLEPHLRATTEHLHEVWDSIRFVRGSMGDEPLIAEMAQTRFQSATDWQARWSLTGGITQTIERFLDKSN